MSRKANPAVVGVFIIGAVTLLITAIIIFGKGQLFKETREWVLYFDGSIKGLSPGSPVDFQGVRIGEVKNIRININHDGHISTPVIITLDPSLINFENKALDPKEELANTKKMIDHGLRAQLQTQSLITGQLLIQLGFHPGKEVRLVAPNGDLPEMPTVPSTVQQLSKTLDKLPLEDIVNNIHSITKNLDKLLNSPDLNDGLVALSSSLKKAELVMAKIEEQITPVSLEAQKVLKSAGALLAENNTKLTVLLDDLKETSSIARNSVEKLTKDLTGVATRTDEQLARFIVSATATTDNAGKMLAGQSEFRHELNDTLKELNAALRAIRLLAEYMEQHPESIITGKAQ